MSTDVADFVGNEISGNFHAVASLPRGVAVLKMEHDTIAAMAVAKPRDFKSIAEEMRTQFKLFPAFAKAAIYSKPVGGDKPARNLSVRAAEAIAEAYGYCKIRTNVELIDGHPDLVRVEASFFDYQKGKIWEDSAIVSKWYMSSAKRGQPAKMVKIPDDRFFQVTVRAAQSKVVREVILRSVAPGLRLEIFDQAEKALAEVLTDEEIEKIIESFLKFNVTQQMIEEFIGRPLAVGWTKDDRLNLAGVYNAIRDGDSTVEAVFGRNDPGESAPEDDGSDPPKTEPPKSVSDFVNQSKVKNATGSAKPVNEQGTAKPVNGGQTAANPVNGGGGSKPASGQASAEKPDVKYQRMIDAAKSESTLRSIGESIQKDAVLLPGAKRVLASKCQSKLAELLRASSDQATSVQPAAESANSEVYSPIYGSYLEAIETVDGGSEDAMALHADLLNDDRLDSVERNRLVALLTAKAESPK